MLEDLEREAGITLSPEIPRADTVAGYVLGRLGRPPAPGETIDCDRYAIVAIDVAGRRVRRVRIVARPATDPPPGG
jgi:CBS domain containing-hemolysin-like protein